MKKRSLSIILSIVILIVACPGITALAALPSSGLVVDSSAGNQVTSEGVGVDDFSQYTTEREDAFSAYPRADFNPPQSSDFFASTAGYSAFKIVKAIDAYGNESMMLKHIGVQGSSNTSANLLPKPFILGTGQIARISYDICFDNIPENLTGTNIFYYLSYGDGTGGFNVKKGSQSGTLVVTSSSESKTHTITENTWYKVICVVDKSNTNKVCSYLTNPVTGEVYCYAKRTTDPYVSSTTNNYSDVCVVKTTTALRTENNDPSFLIDNAELVVYTPANYKPAVKKVSVEETGVATDIKSIDITFDQEIKNVPANVTLSTDGEEDITLAVIKPSAIVGSKYNTYTLTVPTVLKGSTLYTIKLSGFGCEGEDFSFQTAAAAPIVLSSTPTDGAENVSVETNSVTLTFDQAMTAFPDSLTIAGGISATVNPSNDKKSFTISWNGELASDTTYSISLAEFKNAQGKPSARETITFKTEYTGIVTESDTFENVYWTDSSYNSKYNGDVLYHEQTWGTPDVAVFSQVDGYNGGKALKLTTGNKSGSKHPYLTAFKTKNKYGLENNEKLVATWRFNIEEMAVDDAENGKGGSMIAIGGCSNSSPITNIITLDGKPHIYSEYDDKTTGRSIDENHWYNVYYVIENGAQTIYIVDAEGENKGKLVYKRNKGTLGGERIPAMSPSTPEDIKVVTAGRRWINEIVYNESQELLIDDFTLWHINPLKKAQKLSLTQSDSDVVLDKYDENNNSITMTFNQPIIAESTMFELYKGTAGNELAYSTVNASWKDFCTQELSFSNLQCLSNYTLDYSEIKAVSGADLGDTADTATLSFSTEADPNAISIIGDISCNGLAVGDKVSFNLYSKEASSATIIAAFYERSFPEKLTGVEIKDISILPGTTPVELELTETQSADYIKIYIWDSMKTIVPMSRVYEIHSPTDKLDVLMIGNSLSEDAGRYLNDVAEADGLTLDLTVKGIGGSTLSHHAANLKAELAGRTIEEAVAGINAGVLDRVLYFTYENGVYQTATNENQLLLNALRAKQYDIISLQQFADYTDDAFEESLPYLVEEIRKLQPNAEIMLYQTWSSKLDTKAARNYLFKNTIEPAIAKWVAYTGANVENITLEGQPMKVVSAGKAFYIADNKYSWCETAYTAGDGNTNQEAQTSIEERMKGSLGIWRDYNHASYYGCYLADAVWYGTLTGKKAPIGTQANPVVSAPDGITASEHIERLSQLSDIAYQVVMEQSN